MPNDNQSGTQARNTLDRLVVTRDEYLDDDALRARWKFQQPLTNIHVISFFGFVGGVALVLSGNLLGFLATGGSIVASVVVSRWLNYKATTKTRDELLDNIKRLREVHADLDM